MRPNRYPYTKNQWEEETTTVDGITLSNKEITISFNTPNKGFQKMKNILFGNGVK